MDKEKLKEIYPVLKLLKSTKPVSRKALLKCLNSDTRKCLYGCITNCLKNNTISKKKQAQLRKNLKKHANKLRFLSTLGDSPKKRDMLINQSGGFLPQILSIAIPLLTGLLSK